MPNAVRPLRLSRESRLTQPGRMNAGRASSPSWTRSLMIGSLIAGGALGLAAVSNRHAARRAELANPPKGQFIEVDGVRLHYLDRGKGAPLVLLHGNGSSSDELLASGLVDVLAANYRVIVFDRPGYGYSERPSGTTWTAERQADLIARALRRLGAEPALVFGHSWGALVAVALAIRRPEAVRGLILAAGYYYPSVRADVVLMSPPAAPVIGPLLANTLAPIISRMIWRPMIRKMFRPASIPAKFARYSKEMAVRPSQLQASAEESALMIPEAFSLQHHYNQLSGPITIIAGEGDRMANIDKQSARLHKALPGSEFRRLQGVGHMVHQSAVHAIAEAIAMTARRSSPASTPALHDA
jgi:pimeloyl-ACP methyl ester carboxylesterase